jgi:membrane fusion protein, multidrug efflux system
MQAALEGGKTIANILLFAGEYSWTNWGQDCPPTPNADKMWPQWEAFSIRRRVCDRSSPQVENEVAEMADQPHAEGSAMAAAHSAVALPEVATAVEAPDRAIGATHDVSTPSLPPNVHPRSGQRRWWIAGIAIGVLLVAGYFAIPIVDRMINTVSTDDAYVNGHVTFVAPRVAGQVVEVLVDDNYRVRKNELLVRLDTKPYQVIVDEKRAAVAVAYADVIVADDQVRATIAQARAARFKLEHAIEDVNNQVAVLRATVAALQTSKAKLTRAQADYQRVIELQKTPGAVSQQDVDLRQEALRIAEAQLKQSLEQVYEIRVSLGLPAQPEHGDDLTEVPPGLSQNFSSVRAALGQLLQSAAPLGIVPSSYNLTPKQVIAEFYERDPGGDIDKIYKKIIDDAPGIKLAQSQLMVAQSDLAQAELNLSYCDVRSSIAGIVTRREVNPGNNLVAGQSVMAVRAITTPDIWIDANFKETQLARLRIGQAVDLYVDMYGRRLKSQLKGRISGFSMGTGSTLALLPAENATGNFVKVVQRLPVRIELLDYDPEETPLFAGLSVTPYVLVKEEPTGRNAGKVLQPYAPQSKPEKQPETKPEAKPEAKPEK